MSRTASHQAMLSLPSTVSGRHVAEAGSTSMAGGSTSAGLTQRNTTLLQSLVQPTRYHRRVQPHFEVVSMSDPDFVRYNLKRYLPHDVNSDAAASDRAAPRQSSRDWDLSAHSEEAGGPYVTEEYHRGNSRQPHNYRPTTRPSALSDVALGDESHEYQSPLPRAGPPTAPPDQLGAGEGFACSDRGADSVHDRWGSSNGTHYPQRQSSQQNRNRLSEHGPSSPWGVESRGSLPYRHGAEQERGEDLSGRWRMTDRASNSSSPISHTAGDHGAVRQDPIRAGRADAGDMWVDMAHGAYRDHREHDITADLSFQDSLSPASTLRECGQPQGVPLLLVEALTTQRPALRQLRTPRSHEGPGDVGSQRRQPLHQAAVEPPNERKKKKARSKKRHSRAFQNRTMHTWVSTNTTTSVILPSATVRLVPVSTVVMGGGHDRPLDGRWATSAVLSPASPYTLGSAVPGHQWQHSRMEVLEDSADATAFARSHAGSSLSRRYQSETRAASEDVVCQSMPAL